jgi:hypothetical protein
LPLDEDVILIGRCFGDQLTMSLLNENSSFDAVSQAADPFGHQADGP